VRTVEGLEVVGVPDLDAALRVLDLARDDTVPLFRPGVSGPELPSAPGMS
jgi:hypothetical protein